MEDRAILRERAQNIWGSFARKFEPIAQAARLEAMPSQELSRIGGLADAKLEIQTYASAATDPDVYARWGTHPPSGVLLFGQRGVGKELLARSLATLTHTSFLSLAIPKLVLEVGSTSHPDTLRRAFTQPGRLERVVEVSPIYPADIIEALRIHGADAE